MLGHHHRVAIGWLLLLAFTGMAPGQDTAPQGEPAKGAVVYLGPTADWAMRHTKVDRVHTAILSQELARQAFLLAAREELGLQTRDAWLGESLPSPDPEVSFDLIGIPGNVNRIELVRGLPPTQEYVAQVGFPASGINDYAGWLRDMERCSREVFPQLLKQQGFASHKMKAEQGADEAPPTDECLQWLREMNFISQYRAVRQLHAQAGTQDLGLQRMAALIRGYANLGVLCEVHYHPAHDVFKARALLYAQRLALQQKDSPTAIAARAYAFALCGLHASAWDDLQQAGELRSSQAEAEREPAADWEPLLKAFIQYDVDRLTASANGDRTQLAQLLTFLSYELANSLHELQEFGTNVIAAESADCFRIYDGLLWHRSVGSGQMVAGVGPMKFAGMLYERLHAMPDLPAPAAEIVRKRVKEAQGGLARNLFGGGQTPDFEQRRALIKALLQPPAPAAVNGQQPPPRDEFTAAILGNWIAQASYFQTLGATLLQTESLGVAPDEYLDAFNPLIQDHPLAPLADSLRWNVEQKKAGLAKVKQLDLRGLDARCRSLSDVFIQPDPDIRTRNWNTLRRQTDYNSQGRAIMIQIMTALYSADDAEDLLSVSPFSPLAKCVLVEQRWKKYEEKVPEWEQAATQHARLALALGRKYAELERRDDAERMLKSAIELAHDYDAYDELARLYYFADEFDKWKSLYEEALEQPDLGLNHARINNTIARHYIRERAFETALPYAEAAAESYSGWGLQTAAVCYECLHRWEEAEEIHAAVANRYRGHGLDWYGFCKATGKGDPEAALRFLHNDRAPLGQQPNSDANARIAVGYWMEGRTKDAAGYMARGCKLHKDPYMGLMSAVLYDRLQDAKNRDEQLQVVRGMKEGGSKVSAPLATLFSDDLKQGGKAEFDLAQITELCQAEVGNRTFLAAFVVGEYLDIHGRSNDAKGFWARAADPAWDSFSQRLAGMRLIDAGVKAEDFTSLIDISQDKKWRAN